MEDPSDYSPGFGFSMRECQRLRSSIRKRSYFRVDEESSDDAEDNSIGEPIDEEAELDDKAASTEEPIDEYEQDLELDTGEPIDEYEDDLELEDKAEEPIDEYEEEAELEPIIDEYKEEAELEPIDEHGASGDKPNPNPNLWVDEHGASGDKPNPNPNPWIAECNFGTAFLKYPVYTTNQRVDPQPAAQEPDPGWLNRDQPAQPLIRASWAGDFAIHLSRAEAPARCGGVKACVSAKACAEARVAVERLPAEVRWEKVPKYSVWPKSFERWGPNDNDIAVFFFPTLTRHEAAYDSLVMDMVRDDMALKTTLAGAQLLLFTSVELPPLFTRFQGKLYLWGVFRGSRPQLRFLHRI